MSEPLFTVGHSWQLGKLWLSLNEHDAIKDLMEEIVSHTDTDVLEDIRFAGENLLRGLGDANSLDEARGQVPESAVHIATMTETEALSLAWDIIQAVKAMRADAVNRLSLVK
jgi:hypothetical protein